MKKRALDVECPTCFVDPGEPCWSWVLGCELPFFRVHRSRVRAATKAEKEVLTADR